MVRQQSSFAGSVDDESGSRDMPFLQASLETIWIPLYKVHEAIYTISLIGKLAPIVSQQGKQGISRHG